MPFIKKISSSQACKIRDDLKHYKNEFVHILKLAVFVCVGSWLKCIILHAFTHAGSRGEQCGRHTSQFWKLCSCAKCLALPHPPWCSVRPCRSAGDGSEQPGPPATLLGLWASLHTPSKGPFSGRRYTPQQMTFPTLAANFSTNAACRDFASPCTVWLIAHIQNWFGLLCFNFRFFFSTVKGAGFKG